MRAVSVHQPWAWAILHAGKSFENRTWQTRHRGPLVIHAGKSPARLAGIDPATWRARYGVEMPDRSQLVFQALIGVVEVVDCVRVEEVAKEHPGRRWAEGPWCWVLANPRVYAEPIPHRGYQRLFLVAEHLHFNETALRSW
jgi:hypothetical protein